MCGTHKQCCGYGSRLDPYSATLWIWICFLNTDPDPHRQKWDKLEIKGVRLKTKIPSLTKNFFLPVQLFSCFLTNFC